MSIQGFKAVWLCAGGMRVEYYPHIDMLYIIMSGIGSKPLHCTVEDVISTLGDPVWM